MTRSSDLAWTPTGPGPVKTTQRVTERIDYDTGRSNVRFNMYGKEDVETEGEDD